MSVARVMRCAQNCDYGTLKTLLMRGHSPNGTVDHSMRTPLHEACNTPLPGDCALVLLAAGADLYALDKYKRTPLETLVYSSSWSARTVVRAFVSLGVDVDPTISRMYPGWPTIYYDERLLPIGVACPELSVLRNELIVTRAFEVCTALRNLHVSALEMCEILYWACCPSVQNVPFCKIWNIVKLIKHWKRDL